MKIIYIASVFNDECLAKYLDNKPILPYAASKYNTLLFEGLARNGSDVNVISVIPINRNLYRKVVLKGYTLRKNNIKIRFLTLLNLPLIKNLSALCGGFLRTLFAAKGSTLLYDVLVVSASMGALAAAKIRRFRKIGIVTDLPKFQPVSEKAFMLKTNEKVVSQADAYIFLTQQMNDEVNPENKPYLVLEGHVDADMKAKDHAPFIESPKRVIYAGSLMKIYGISLLCEAFVKYALPNEELHIYGNGDYADELSELQKNHPNIFYHGNRPNEEVVNAELSATLLVNPRPTDGEYTKFSFPSKTLEYMVSGTPVLSSRLPGIPDEYEKYLFYFDENSVDSLGKKIREVLDMPVEELHQRGQASRRFALEQKNNIVQSKKIIDFCYKLGVSNGVDHKEQK